MSSVGVLGARSYIGLAEQVAFETAVSPPTHWARINSSSLASTPSIVPRPYMSAFSAIHQVKRDFAHVKTDVGGEVIAPFLYDGPESLFMLKHAFGAVNTTGGAAPYRHTFSLDENGVDAGFTAHVQHGKHPTLTTVQQFTGCRINRCRIIGAANDFVNVAYDIIGRNGGLMVAQAGTESFAAVEQALAHQLSDPTWNSSSLKFLSWEVELNKNLERKPQVGSLYTDCPAPSGGTDILVRGTVRWVADDLYNAFVANTTDDFVIEFTGTGDNAAELTLHNLVWESVSAPINTEGELTFEVQGRAYSDASNQGISLWIENSSASPL